MTKKIYTLFSLLFFFISTSYAIEAGNRYKNDSISPDSLKINSLKRHADALIESVFKSDETLSNADSITREFDKLPSFGIYKNNYVVTGTTLKGKPGENNSDAKFQISIMQRMTNSVLPFKTYLFLTYSQLAFWDIYKDSFPFSDINFNPTIGIGRVLNHKNRFLGTMMFQIEHESNGKDDVLSRSWNKISFGSVLLLDKHWTVQTKMWIPIIDGTMNKDIVSYKGWGHIGVDYKNRRLNVGILATKRAGKFFDYNITANLSYKAFPNGNQHLFIEYFHGYGENLLMYNEYRHRVRIGFVIMPGFFRIY